MRLYADGDDIVMRYKTESFGLAVHDSNSYLEQILAIFFTD